MGTAVQRGSDPVKCKNREVVKIVGRIIGTSAPGVAIVDGSGFTVARTGTGTYVLTDPTGPWAAFFGADFTPMSSTHKNGVQISAYSISARTITIVNYLVSSQGAADLGTAEEIWFEINIGQSVKS